MINFFKHLTASTQQASSKVVELSLAGLALTLGLTSIANPAIAYEAESTRSAQPDLTAANSLVSQQSRRGEAARSLPDGVYHFGQSKELDQLGTEYFVVEIREGKAIGAFYMPHSSYDCFYGSFEPGKFALTVINSYDRASHPFAIALQQDYSVASNRNATASTVSLEGFHRLDSLSDANQEWLNTCKADLKDRVWQ